MTGNSLEEVPTGESGIEWALTRSCYYYSQQVLDQEQREMARESLGPRKE